MNPFSEDGAWNMEHGFGIWKKLTALISRIHALCSMFNTLRFIFSLLQTTYTRHPLVHVHLSIYRIDFS